MQIWTKKSISLSEEGLKEYLVKKLKEDKIIPETVSPDVKIRLQQSVEEGVLLRSVSVTFESYEEQK